MTEPALVAESRAFSDHFMRWTLGTAHLLFLGSFWFTHRMADLGYLPQGMLVSAAFVFGAIILPMVVFWERWMEACHIVTTWDRRIRRIRRNREEQELLSKTGES